MTNYLSYLKYKIINWKEQQYKEDWIISTSALSIISAIIGSTITLYALLLGIYPLSILTYYLSKWEYQEYKEWKETQK